MRFLGKRNITEHSEDMTGKVRARIEVMRLDKATRQVRAYLIACDTGKTVYKTTYETKAKTDFYAYNHASDELKRLIQREDYILYGEISTNADLPGIFTTGKRMR